MTMDENEIAAIRPDFIILDEFHRCGVKQWGQGTQALLNTYPNTSLLGLSATNIRFLDNQRDMAKELFDGYIASEISLGEAIAREILKPPKYVLSVYSFQKDLEKYEERVEKLRNPALCDRAEELLHTFRRRLEDADGVILFRPTASPIICKQQIGRALSAGSAKTPVVSAVVCPARSGLQSWTRSGCAGQCGKKTAGRNTLRRRRIMPGHMDISTYHVLAPRLMA